MTKSGKTVNTVKLIVLISLIMLIGVLLMIGKIKEIKEKNNINVNIEKIQADTTIETTTSVEEIPVLTADSGIITSAAIVQRETGTAPFDEEEGDGNDTSADDNIVRSFDQVTWTIEANMGINNTEYGSEDAQIYNSFKGGKIHVEAVLPENCQGLMDWDIEAMNWAEGTGETSEDGLILTAEYQLGENTITVPGKQIITVVLSVKGASNGLEIKPSFRIWMEGNETDKTKESYEAVEIEVEEAVKVSSKPGYNIKLISNDSCRNKAVIDFGEGEQTGRMYGYALLLQLYNTDTEKGLKGLEYPTGDITFDINTKLEAVETIEGKKVTTDITDLATPLLWNYKINVGHEDQNPDYGNIEDRNMYFGYMSGYSTHLTPYGKVITDRSNSIYNSGNVYMEQKGTTIKTVINNYSFDGIFPKFNRYYSSNTAIVYSDNIGCFSAAYFQLFVPDNEETTNEQKTYYLTVSDSNMKVTSKSGIETNNQVITNDDSSRVQHYITKPGSYLHYIYIDNDGNGKSRKVKGQTMNLKLSVYPDISNDIGTEIKSVNRLVKFDGEGLEPILEDDGSKFKAVTDTMTWKAWYVTKKDGSNWTSQEERNNANIEDLLLYENLEDIPNGHICVGMYFESQDGIISIPKTWNPYYLSIKMKIKDEAQIGQTYGICQSSDYWTVSLDRTTQTIENPDAEYPKPVWSRHNQEYIKTEYDENGEVITGTNNGDSSYGSTVLVLGAESSISTTVTDTSNGEIKTNYDLGRNENEVNFKVSPVLSEFDASMPTGLTGVTVKVKDILPKGLAYVSGSSNKGEPSITQNEDGTTILVWEIYDCTVGEEIEPVTFKAKIDENTVSGTTYTNTAIIEPEEDKVGLSSLELRTATYSFQVTNLASHRLYKEVNTPIIESNGTIKYTLTYSNKTDSNMPDFQLLDILPYNGDGRGSSYNGTYTIDRIEIKQTSDGTEVSNDNLSLYTTTNIEARNISPKEESIGTSEIWNEREIGGTLNEAATVFAIKGEIQKNTEVKVEMYLKTQDNKPGNVYANSATAQTSKATEVIETAVSKSQVVSRIITGNIWYDTNENGVKDTDEIYASNIEVIIKKVERETVERDDIESNETGSDNGEEKITLTEAVDANGNKIGNLLTDDEGKYTFRNLPKGEYVIQIETESKYKLTEAYVGSNLSINSKFTEVSSDEESTDSESQTNKKIKQSEIITKLDSIESPEIIQEYINAGLVVKDSKVTVKYMEIDETENNSDNKELSEKEEKIGKVEEEYSTEKKQIQDYVYIKDTGNTSGTLTEDEIEVIYYYAYNKQDITVSKEWDDNNDKAQKRPESVTLILTGSDESKVSQTLNATNSIEDNMNKWIYTFKDMPVYTEDGERIEYTLNEESTGSEFYIKTSVNQESKTVTNKFVQSTEKVQIQVNKIWDDNGNVAGKRPSNITLQIKEKSSSNDASSSNIISDDVNSTGEVVVAEEIVSGNRYTNEGWSCIFELPKYDENNNEIEYSISEKETGNIFYTSKNTTIDQETKTITNKFEVPDERISLKITKIWEDNNNKAGKRPTSVTLKLTGSDFQEYSKRLTSENATSSAENIWKGTIDNLPKYDENGNEIIYTISEENVENIYYSEENIEINQNTKTITNKFKVPDDKIEMQVMKVWEDNENDAGKRPESVEIYVTGNGQEYSHTFTEADAINSIEDSENEQTTTASSKWEYTFSNLPKYDANGDEIKYIIDEKPVTSIYYTKTGVDQENKIITNTFTVPTETIQIQITKKWEDRLNIKGKRPESITLQIKAGEKVVKEETVIGNKYTEEGWSRRLEVPKYDANGDEIQYTIAEKDTGNIYYTAEINQETQTITNKMTKIPGELKIKYIDKNTNEEIADDVSREGIVGEEYDTEKDKKEIPGYTLIEEPEEKIGKYTEEEQVKTYYYAKTSKVIVKYLKEESKQVLAEQEEINGYETKEYETEPKTISGYTCVKDTENIQGNMSAEEIEVIYYYKKNTKVTVKYLEIDNTEDNTDNKEVAEKEEIQGYVGKEYSTEKKNIENLTFVESTKNTAGNMTEEEIEVIYYYAKNTSVIIKYLEKDDTKENNKDNIILASQEVITGYIGKEYETKAKIIENYTVITSTENTTGTMEEKPIEVIYYYAKNTKVQVQHIDKETGEILKEETISGNVGDIVETKAKDIEGYILIESPENTRIEMKKDEEVKVRYYYSYISTGVVEKHIDEITEEVIESERYKGEEGDYYEITSKEIEGYDIVESKLPENNTGIMTDKLIEVKYYYIRKTTLVVEYIDKETGNKLTEDKITNGHQNDTYKTEAKEFENYTLEKVPENAQGILEVNKNADGTYQTETKVTYYYTQKAGGVIEKHIDEKTGKIIEEQKHDGKLGEDYEVTTKDFEDYDVVKSKLPTNSKGTLTKDEIEVKFYYRRKGKVIVEYVDENTEKLIYTEEINGYEGDSYETEAKNFDGYDIVKESLPENAKGIIEVNNNTDSNTTDTSKMITVKYYYKKKSEVEIKYIDQETGYEIADKEKIEGYVKEKFETKEKNIQYYNFVGTSGNINGEMTEEKTTVIYYYKKQTFNLKIDKWISDVSVNNEKQKGRTIETKDQAYKIEILSKKINTANVKIKYTIRITNNGEVEGTADKITELIPKGFSYYQEDNLINWQEENTDNSSVNAQRLICKDLEGETIKPGEYRDLEIVLRWNKGENNMGVLNNVAVISSTVNPAKFADKIQEDNVDEAELMVIVATGENKEMKDKIIVNIMIITFLAIELMTCYVKTQKKKNKRG